MREFSTHLFYTYEHKNSIRKHVAYNPVSEKGKEAAGDNQYVM